MSFGNCSWSLEVQLMVWSIGGERLICIDVIITFFLAHYFWCIIFLNLFWSHFMSCTENDLWGRCGLLIICVCARISHALNSHNMLAECMSSKSLPLVECTSLLVASHPTQWSVGHSIYKSLPMSEMLWSASLLLKGVKIMPSFLLCRFSTKRMLYVCVLCGGGMYWD